MADSGFFASLADAMTGKPKAAPRGVSQDVVVDDPKEGFVVMPSDMAQSAGYTFLLGIRPDQVPKDPAKRKAMTDLYRQRKADRIKREQQAEIEAREDARAAQIASEMRAEKLRPAEEAADRQFAALNAPPPAARPAVVPARTAPVGPAPVAQQVRAPAPEPLPAPAVDPDAEAKAWARDFVPQATGFAPDEGAALMALAKASGRPAGAPLSLASPDVEGVSSRAVPTPPLAQPMAKAATSAPMPSGAVAQGAGSEPDYMALLRDAQRSDGYSQGIRALGDQFRDAMNLILNRQGAPSNMAADSGNAVRDFQARQALLATQSKAKRDDRLADATIAGKTADQTAAAAKLEKMKTELAASASDEDPSSPASQRAQAIAAELIGQRVSPEILSATPASQIGPLLLKYGVSLTNAEQGAGLRALAETRAGQESEEERALRQQQMELARQKFALDSAEFEERKRQFGLTLGDRQEARDDTKEEKKTAHAEKLAERNVGGFSFNPEDPPSITGAKTMADVAVARDEVLGSLGRLESLYDKHGPTMIGPVAGQMETEWMNITNRLRTLNEMGVPNGADYAMLAKQIQDPTGLRAKSTSAGRAKAQFAQLRDQVRRKVDATAKAYKYVPGSAPKPQASPDVPDLDLSTDVKEPVIPGVTPPPQGAAPAPGGVRVVSTKGLKPGELKTLVQEGETIRTKETKRLMRKTNGKLIYVQE